eukprot:m.29472 g.29472  ORF g.29472 m.29472 type:complete len:73 (-) comp13727_c0_seq1:34-252(-)
MARHARRTCSVINIPHLHRTENSCHTTKTYYLTRTTTDTTLDAHGYMSVNPLPSSKHSTFFNLIRSYVMTAS